MRAVEIDKVIEIAEHVDVMLDNYMFPYYAFALSDVLQVTCRGGKLLRIEPGTPASCIGGRTGHRAVAIEQGDSEWFRSSCRFSRWCDRFRSRT